MKWFRCGVIFFLLAVPAPSVLAAGDYIRFNQGASGTISAILARSVDPCAGSNIFPVGVTSISHSDNEYVITSFFAVLDPVHCPDVPQRYEVTAFLGTAADGRYSVVWTIGPLMVTGTFDVGAGVLQTTLNSVPTLTLQALAFLVALVALIGLFLSGGWLAALRNVRES